MPGFERRGRAAGACSAGHHPLGPDTLGREPAQRAQREAGGGGLARVGHPFDLGQARCVIRRDIDQVAAPPPVAASRPCAGDAMAGLVKAPGLPEIRMDQRARATPGKPCATAADRNRKGLSDPGGGLARETTGNDLFPTVTGTTAP